jgi:cell shape-determining protein MreC
MPLFPIGNSYRRRNALISSGRALLAACIFFIVIVLLALRTFAPGFLARVATPVWQVGQAATDGLAGFANIFGNSSELTRERDTLQNENLTLAEENRLLRAQMEDLTRLTASSTVPSGIRAGVTARPPVAPYDTLLVGAGTNEGVTAGAYVYGPGGVPLGTVDGVSLNTSRIALYSTGGRTTDGWVGEKRIAITLVGRGAGAFEATLPRNSGIAVNDVVYAPGPGALPIGTIVKIDTDPSSPRDDIFIAPYVNLFSLTWVTIAR